MSKQPKTTTPTDADLQGNPLIGGSKGVTASQSTPDDLEDAEGENTVEGDVANESNAYGGIDKPTRSGGPVSDPPRRTAR